MPKKADGCQAASVLLTPDAAPATGRRAHRAGCWRRRRTDQITAEGLQELPFGTAIATGDYDLVSLLPEGLPLYLATDRPPHSRCRSPPRLTALWSSSRRTIIPGGTDQTTSFSDQALPELTVAPALRWSADAADLRSVDRFLLHQRPFQLVRDAQGRLVSTRRLRFLPAPLALPGISASPLVWVSAVRTACRKGHLPVPP